MPVSSAIMEPLNKQVVIHNGKISVKGWAYITVWSLARTSWSKSRRRICMVRSTYKTFVYKTQICMENMAYRSTIDVEGWLELDVRWDNSLNIQPTFVRSAWNSDLNVTSSCHRVKIFSIKKSHAGTRAKIGGIRKARTVICTYHSTNSVQVADSQRVWGILG